MCVFNGMQKLLSWLGTVFANRNQTDKSVTVVSHTFTLYACCFTDKIFRTNKLLITITINYNKVSFTVLCMCYFISYFFKSQWCQAPSIKWFSFINSDGDL